MTTPELMAEPKRWAIDALRDFLPAGYEPSPNTLTRWVTTGVAGPDGELVVLESLRIGGRLMTSDAAVRRFIERQQPPAQLAIRFYGPVGELVSGEEVARRGTAERTRAATYAGQELERMGC